MTARDWVETRVRRLPEPFRQEWRALLFFAVILVLAAGLFFEVVEDMVWGDPLAGPDQAAYAFLQNFRTPALDRFLIGITELGDTFVVVSIAAAVAVWLVRERAWHTLAYWLMAIGGGSLINSAIKLALQRARPGDMHYDGVSVFSFPSGHSTTNALLYGFLIIIMSRKLPFVMRIPVIIALILFVGLIAFSRLYLGAHWLSDVAGGLFFGSAWLALLGIFYMWRPAEPVEPLKLLVIALVTLVIAGGLNIALNHDTDMVRYAAQRMAA
ncbi:MAG TPA: phosphatase PAP2 family protein [Asticcacaulis sp.]|nr:phosphatase PAP2 family protein [Asticcacaulis sp.]